jgi:hypothetical protein
MIRADGFNAFAGQAPHKARHRVEQLAGRLTLNANHTGGREPLGNASFSENDENGTTHRLSMPSQRRQWTTA